MHAAIIVPIPIKTATAPLPLDTSSESLDTFLFNSSIDLIKCFILSAHNFSCVESLIPKEVFTIESDDFFAINYLFFKKLYNKNY